ncbi:MAG: ribonuclease D [Pseudomonadales bacterium]
MNNTDFVFIDSDSALAEMVTACLEQPVIALDTEFIRTDTFYPKPALLQIYDRRQIYLVDPLKITDLEPLKTLFNSPTTVKVMHSCSEDMDVFSRMLGCYPKPLMDTQVAASIVGMDFSMSYQRLVESILDKQLDKAETRSDWLQRPLTDKQLAYAADDVLWLLDVHDHLVEQLNVLGREPWMTEECDGLISRAEHPMPFDQYYLKIKAAWRLDPQSLNSLRSLCAWREEVAREEDVPRSRVVADAILLELSRQRPDNKISLSEIPEIRFATVRTHGDAILEAIATAEAVDSGDYPPAMLPTGNLEARTALKSMKQAVDHAAKNLKIPEALLGRRRDLEAYLFATESTSQLLGQGWRARILAPVLDPIVSIYQAPSKS